MSIWEEHIEYMEEMDRLTNWKVTVKAIIAGLIINPILCFIVYRLATI